VLSVKESNTYIESGYESAVKFVEPKNFKNTLENFLTDDNLRHKLENDGFDFFSKKDICSALHVALKNI
jgi:hypothetical protein